MLNEPIRITPHEWVRQPWLNGKGESFLIWDGRSPALPGVQIFRTPITQAAPFSDYAGWDRIFTVVGGNPLELEIDGRRKLVVPHRPVRFAGEDWGSVALPTGPAEVLNVICLRAQWRELAVGEAPEGRSLAILHLIEPSGDDPHGLRKGETILGGADLLVPDAPGCCSSASARASSA